MIFVFQQLGGYLVIKKKLCGYLISNSIHVAPMIQYWKHNTS